MNKIQISEDFSISGQVSLDEIKTLANEGVKTLICNRPDGEEANQITCTEIIAAAKENGINFIHIPVAGKNIPTEPLNEFNQVIDSCDHKIHAYCKTGMRAAIFWALSYARTHSASDVLVKMQTAGINLEPVTEQIENICNQ